MQMKEQVTLCCSCKKELILRNVNLVYMGHNFTTILPRCPECGQVFLDEETVKTTVREIEQMLEEK